MKLSKNRRNALTALAFLAPNFIGFLIFVAFPVLFSGLIVLTNWSIKPAIHTRFIGLQNLWQLVGFRPVAEAGAAAGTWAPLVAHVGSYALLIAGTILALIGLGRKWGGLRGGGVIGLVAGVALTVLAFPKIVGVGSAFVGLSMLFVSFFFLTDDDASWWGCGALGPLLAAAALLLQHLSRRDFLASWEPLDPLFWKYLYNTLYLMFLIPLSIAGSLILALVLSQPLLKAAVGSRTRVGLGMLALGLAGAVAFWCAGRRDTALFWLVFWMIAAFGLGGVVLFRTLFYLPSFTAGIAVMLLWKHMLNPDFGPINEALRLAFHAVGIQAETPHWLSDPAWAKPALMMMGFWISVGGANMLLYLAGLSNIPQELYEAASIDGAGRWSAFWNVTWPQLAPTTFFIVIMSTIAGLQGGFEQARVMTEGGPAGTTKTLAYYVWEKAFQELSLGYGSAIAWVLFAIVFVLTAFNWRFGNRYVNY